MLISGFGFSGFSSSSNLALEPEYRNAINVRFFGCEVSPFNLYIHSLLQIQVDLPFHLSQLI